MALDGDVQDFMIEKSCVVLKSAEELDRLTVDEKLKPIERAVYLLSSGQEVQRISVVNSLPELLRDNFQDCIRRIVPKIREVVRVADADMQYAASEIFIQILQRNLVPMTTYTQTFLLTVFMCIENRDTEIAENWLQTLINIIDLLPKEVIAKEVLVRTVTKGQLHQSVHSRIACCRILGKAVSKCDKSVVKRDFLPTVRMLCQDVEHEVRATMTRHLDPVARALGIDDTKVYLLPDLVELSKDEQFHVRLATFDAIVSILDVLDNEALCLTVIPLVWEFCKDALSKQDATLISVAQQFGRLCHGMRDYFDDEQKKYFIEFYKKKLCRVGLEKKGKADNPSTGNTGGGHHMNKNIPFSDDEEEFGGRMENGWDLDECRRYAAYNMPAMALFVGPKSFKTELCTCFSSLCNDYCGHVRETIAAGFHEVIKILGTLSACVLPELIQLLNDNSIDVLASGFIAHLPESLDILCHNGRMVNSDAKLYDLLCAIVKCDAVIFQSNNWRLQEDYTKMLCCLPTCFSSDVVYTKVSPLVLRKLMSARALPVRRAAVLAQLQLIRNNSHEEERDGMCQKLIEEFAKGRSFFRRSLYIDVCQSALDVFSRAFFKKYFCEALLALHSDPVPNIRLRVCAMLPRMKRTMRAPADKVLMQMLEVCVRNRLLHERDRDVMSSLRKAVTELDEIPLEMESQLAQKTEEDRVDQKKVEEEKNIFEGDERRSVSADGVNPARKKSIQSATDKSRETSKQAATSVAKKPARSGVGASSSATNSNNNKKPPDAAAAVNNTVTRQPAGHQTVAQSNAAPSALGIKKKVSSSLSSGSLPSVNSLSTAPSEPRKTTITRRISLHDPKQKL